MRKLVALFILYTVQFALWFRYRVTVKGLENLNKSTLLRSGGILFLPNHPTVFVDPTLVTLAIWKKFPIRPMIVEYMYYMPVVNWVMRFMNAIPIPNFVNSSNSIKKKKADQVVQTVIEDIKQGDNFLIYPAGRVKHSALEVIGGSSGVHRILQAAPEANVVLVRITGLWGSSFSRALTGRTPPMFETMFHGFKKALKNFLFFTPRREVTIEFVPAPADFPYQGSRLEMNRYLEKWYNRPDGLTQTTEDEPGESLYLVSYSMWSDDFPKLQIPQEKEVEFDLAKISPHIQEEVKKKLAEMSNSSPNQIEPTMNLASDLGLDSLDAAELQAFLEEQYDVTGVPAIELTTVAKIMALAAKQMSFNEQVEEELKGLSKWEESIKTSNKERVTIPQGATIPEVFLNNCERMKNAIACGDAKAGVLTYAQAKMRVLLLAEYIRHLPGSTIGILLPSSVAAYLTVLATQLAGKVPVLINWTVGPRHLESVVNLSKVQVVLSSWAFLDRLENVDLNGLENIIVTLEDARRTFTLKDKLKAFYRSKLGTNKLLNLFGIQNLSKEAQAVLLFTSGTESLPKGVPLTHENILSNQRAAVERIQVFTNDILIGILPPFHAFGFTVSGLLPLIANLKVAYYPDPTDGKGVAKAVERWKGTFICGAPTFLKNMFKASREGQLKSLRLCVSGAERAPVELFEYIKKANMHLIEGYGITECSPVLTVNDSGDAGKGVGKPLANLKMCIVDLEHHRPVPQGQQGLVVVQGPSIFSGYLNPSVASPFINVDGEMWYSTGDLGYVDEKGNLILSGRLKRFVKIGAEMVSLAAIEGTLQQYLLHQSHMMPEEGPLLAICAKEEAGEKAKIFLFSRLPVTVEEANKSLKDAGFSNLVKISKVQQLPEIPIMGTGKINYRALEAQLPNV